MTSDELSRRIERLRRKLLTESDPQECEDLEASIAALEAQRQPQAQQTITGHAQVDVAVVGDVHGNIYLDGRRADQATQLLRDYLMQLSRRCRTLPLEALHQQARHDDRHAIGLGAVYTQLTVDGDVVRERFTRAELTKRILEAYLEQHMSGALLPWQRRTLARIRKKATKPKSGSAAEMRDMQDLWEGKLWPLPADLDELNAAIRRSDGIEFVGPALVTDAIASNQELVLLGEPGSGKSTALRFLTLTLAEVALDPTIVLAERLAGWKSLGAQGRLVPLLLPLLLFARKLATTPTMRGSADELWAHIADSLEPGNIRTGLAEAVHAELSAGQVLLLLDGLDEVVGEESRRKVVRAVSDFARVYATCRIVVSCRVRAYLGETNAAWQLTGWTTATLQPWDAAQQQFFIDAWYHAAVVAGSLPDVQRESRVATLQRAVAASRDLQRLSNSPLLLTVMALVHLNDGRLPEDRVTLYSRCIDILLAQWEQRGKDQSDYGPLMAYIGLPDRDIQRLRPLLTRAAYTAQQAATADNPGALGRATLERMAMDYLKRLDHPNAYDGALRLLEYTDHRAGLLQAATVGDTYVFPHLTFQEYLAGLELTSGVGVVQRILAHHRDDRWQVPILLGVGDHVSGGKLEMPYQLLNELLSHPDPASAEAQHDVIFACELTFDVGWDRLELGGNSFKKLRRDMAQALAVIVEGTALPTAKRVHAGVLLGNVGDLRPGGCDLARMPFVSFAGGAFVIGDDPQIKPVIVSPFELARYPVTNAQYKLFINGGGYDAKASWWDAAAQVWLARDDAMTPNLETYQKRRYKDQPEWWDDERYGSARPNHPVVGISWYEATAFCRWLTEHRKDEFLYRLPSELEWEYAGRGSTRRIYPWGNEEPSGERANFNNLHTGTTAVGCFPTGATPEGLLDMAGNVWEWNRSEYRPYPYDPNDGREDGGNPTATQKRFTLRGGGWDDQSIYLRASDRYYVMSDYHYSNVGFRLARHKK